MPSHLHQGTRDDGKLDLRGPAADAGQLGVPDAALDLPRPDINGRPVKAWRLLMSVIEHEVHHRSQLASYLEMMGAEPPQIFGLEVDDVAELSTKLASDHSGPTAKDGKL